MQALFKRITIFLHLNKRLSKYLIFLLVSFVFWFLTIMSKQYQTTLTIPIEYINLSESKQLINTPQENLKITVKSPGFYLLSNNLFKSKSLSISVNTLDENKAEVYSQQYWVANKNHHQLNELLSSDIKIISVFPDTLFLRFQKKYSKKVPIVFNGRLNFAEQYRLKDKILISPDSIFVFGTKVKLAQISAVQTQYKEFENLDKAITTAIGLNKLDDVSFAEQNLQIYFEVEKFTEKVVEVPLQAINVPKGYKIKFYPPKVSLVTTVAFEDYDKLNTSFFVANVNASQTSGKNKLEVYVNQKPTFAELVKIKPSRVEFLLIKQ
jgi:hypothetical protein